MMGNVVSPNTQEPSAYVTDCSIHRSYQRAVAVHASNQVLVAHNVAFDIRSHAFFVEDGVEERSVFEGNLAVLVQSSANMLTSDLEASGFWSPSPSCIWRHNVAVRVHDPRGSTCCGRRDATAVPFLLTRRRPPPLCLVDTGGSHPVRILVRVP
jgi:hypothetical protein